VSTTGGANAVANQGAVATERAARTVCQDCKHCRPFLWGYFDGAAYRLAECDAYRRSSRHLVNISRELAPRQYCATVREYELKDDPICPRFEHRVTLLMSIRAALAKAGVL
jgi:hypothetical protein